MTKERLIEIFDDADLEYGITGRILKGLQIIAKYLPDKEVIESAEHDTIYLASGDDLIKAGLTEADAIELARLWFDYDEELDCLIKNI